MATPRASSRCLPWPSLRSADRVHQRRQSARCPIVTSSDRACAANGHWCQSPPAPAAIADRTPAARRGRRAGRAGDAGHLRARSAGPADQSGRRVADRVTPRRAADGPVSVGALHGRGSAVGLRSCPFGERERAASGRSPPSGAQRGPSPIKVRWPSLLYSSLALEVADC